MYQNLITSIIRQVIIYCSWVNGSASRKVSVACLPNRCVSNISKGLTAGTCSLPLTKSTPFIGERKTVLHLEFDRWVMFFLFYIATLKNYYLYQVINTHFIISLNQTQLFYHEMDITQANNPVKEFIQFVYSKQT